MARSATSAMYAARMHILDGIDKYEYRLMKEQAALCMLQGDLDEAVYCTQVALFIMRLRRFH